MTAKSVTGIIILALNFAGLCFMIFMFFAGKGKRSRFASLADMGPNGPGQAKHPQADPGETKMFNRADYLLDDLDLSEFDDLNFDDEE